MPRHGNRLKKIEEEDRITRWIQVCSANQLLVSTTRQQALLCSIVGEECLVMTSKMKDEQMGIIENSKEIVSLVQKLGDAELYKRILALEGEIIELTKENRELLERLAALTRSQDVINTLHFDSPFYVNTDGSELYCAKCIEVEKKPIHVVATGQLEMRRRVYFCPECKTKYPDRREKPRPYRV
jgi:hypothetical protein